MSRFHRGEPYRPFLSVEKEFGGLRDQELGAVRLFLASSQRFYEQLCEKILIQTSVLSFRVDRGIFFNSPEAERPLTTSTREHFWRS